MELGRVQSLKASLHTFNNTGSNVPEDLGRKAIHAQGFNVLELCHGKCQFLLSQLGVEQGKVSADHAWGPVPGRGKARKNFVSSLCV